METINENINFGDASATVNAAIDVLEKELTVVEEELKPRIIYAPITGKISNIYKGDGEFVRAGESIFGIESTEPKYILGYVRPPFTVKPEPGVKVQVRTRRPDRSYFASEITKVGGQIKFIERGLVRPGLNSESGLPVQIKVVHSEELKLYPGEYVDIVLDQ
ncbi:HlyD family efflux transporter periplasmic adaptor subunit [Gracilimonas sp.]|uniref:HlyD family efflux transporter periplasmic adaptor subunit n=1 Tax=Gracilimonas sp. TaxID=1974203 RepID=UPI0028728B41|nr:HlyD family efflux transporter periplasmic adaptor subunit [Gracilimonas sp.]